jgi:hypothetical protein
MDNKMIYCKFTGHWIQITCHTKRIIHNWIPLNDNDSTVLTCDICCILTTPERERKINLDEEALLAHYKAVDEQTRKEKYQRDMINQQLENKQFLEEENAKKYEAEVAARTFRNQNAEKLMRESAIFNRDKRDQSYVNSKKHKIEQRKKQIVSKNKTKERKREAIIKFFGAGGSIDD